MARQFLLSLISIFILSMYQINHSLTYTISHSGHGPIHDDRLVLINQYLHQVIYCVIKIDYLFLLFF